MQNLSYNAKRVIAGALTLLVIFSLINYYGDLGFLGSYAVEAVGISVTLLFIDLAYIGPTVGEISEHKRK